ncbi:MAG: calcium-transporting P-type ATPase, PMR1-type [Candidatus Aureabacteria bacterium]|nr:calcium-transporting P-type ATPase, PMR1-type [Candidatus Auribacterota bacterium]
MIPVSQKSFYRLTADETAAALQVDTRTGLSEGETSARLEQYGPNQLQEKKGTTPLQIFIEQFQDFIIWVLIGAALVSGFLQEWIDALAIIAIVIINAILGFVQEYRAEKSLAALKKLSSPTSKVIRDGQHGIIPSSELVPGDLVELEAGDNVPADSRLVWLTANFSVHEASLTGESTPVLKTVHSLEEKEVPLADRANMVYLGTSISFGKARALVTGTGMQTELGKIAHMIQEIEHEATPLQRKLEAFGKWIVYLCFALVAMVFALGLLRGGKVLDMFLTAVSLAVAAIPEGLPAVVTIALALGVQRMVRRHALIRKLPSVETLGCATVICSDKTGTLTKNEMTAQAIYTGGSLFRITGIGYEPTGEFLLDNDPARLDDHPALSETLKCAALCNSAQLVKDNGGYKIVGDPTEGALLTAAAKADIWKNRIEEALPFIEEIPFDSERKKMTMVRKRDGQLIAFVKGAPDILIDDCTALFERSGIRTLSVEDRKAILASNSALADQAMRVLAVAYRIFETPPEDYEPRTIEKNLTFVGLIAMIDPPREEVKAAIAECKSAGIKTVMITGDHKNTAVAIARQLGFFKDDSIALSGEEMDKLGEAEFANEVARVPVYARVSPEHKLRIVRAWRTRGDIVAMTGDGVNDAPAVKEADIGVAMGITGTDVTKEVSDMVITDDNFASIVAAVEEGRGIYSNIQKFIHYLLSCNAGEILVMFVSSLVGWPLPLLPIQILWVNLVTDGLPALALGVDPVDPGIMDRPPRPPHEAVVTRQRAYIMLLQGAFIALCSLAAFHFVFCIEKEGIERARTAAFIVLAVSQLFHSFNCRSMTESLFRLGIFSNGKLVIATALSFALQMGVVYVPFLQGIFKTEVLGIFDWLLVVAISSLPLWAMEIVKAVNRRVHFLRSL